jgi:hypothetical protein
MLDRASPISEIEPTMEVTSPKQIIEPSCFLLFSNLLCASPDVAGGCYIRRLSRCLSAAEVMKLNGACMKMSRYSRTGIKPAQSAKKVRGDTCKG